MARDLEVVWESAALDGAVFARIRAAEAQGDCALARAYAAAMEGAYVAAGSSITQDVPAGSLGIARGRQANVEGWVGRKKG